MIKYGTISDIDAEKGLARVKFDDLDIVSKWIPVAVTKSKEDSFSFMFDVDEHVACLMDERCENGLVLSAIYSEAKRPDGGNKDKIRMKFKDGAVIEYDRSSHTLTIDGIEKANITTKEATIKADTKVTIDCTDNEITGDLKVGGKLEVQQGIESVTGGVKTMGDIETQAGDVKAPGNITLLLHKHPTAAPGAPSTPIP